MEREMVNCITPLRKVVIEQIEEAISFTQNKKLSQEDQVHELRKNIKRIRSLVRLFKSILTEQEFHNLNEHIADLGRALTFQRESTVNLQTFLEFGNTVDEAISATSKRKIIEVLSQELSEAYSNKDGKYQKIIINLSFQLTRLKDWVQIMPLRDFPLDVAFSSIENTLHKTTRLFKDSQSSLHSEIVHKWRRFNKHLYFQMRFSKLISKEENRAMLVELNRLSDLLGKEHDLYMLDIYLKEKLQKQIPIDEILNLKTYIGHKRYLIQKQTFAMGKALYSNYSINFEPIRKVSNTTFRIVKLKKKVVSAEI
jgi:CHAD domain-containing protein